MTYHINVKEVTMSTEEKEELLERRHTTWHCTGNLSEDSSVHLAREAYFAKGGNGIVEFTVENGNLAIRHHSLDTPNCAYRMVGGALQWWAPLKGGWDECENASAWPLSEIPKDAYGDQWVIRTRTQILAVRGLILNTPIQYGETPIDAWWKAINTLPS